MRSDKSTQSLDLHRRRAACAIDEALDRLAQNPVCGYLGDGAPATEPTALAAMALLAHARWPAAAEALDWLAALQSDDGSLGVNAEHRLPRWPTGWAVLAWQVAVREVVTARACEALVGRVAGVGLSAAKETPVLTNPIPLESPTRRPRGFARASLQPRPPGRASAISRDNLERWQAAAGRAAGWLKSMYGQRGEPTPIVGHNTQLRGWPWVDTTHSWVEPTAISVLALKAADSSDGPRVREAVALLLDRMIPSGGWNQANKIILGSPLRPHVQPTGLTLAALHGENGARDHVHRSLDYLKRRVSPRTASASLSYAVLGAAAHGAEFPGTDRCLASAACRTLEGDNSPYKLALLCLAAKGVDCPWFNDRGVGPVPTGRSNDVQQHGR